MSESVERCDIGVEVEVDDEEDEEETVGCWNLFVVGIEKTAAQLHGSRIPGGYRGPICGRPEQACLFIAFYGV